LLLSILLISEKGLSKHIQIQIPVQILKQSNSEE